MDSQVLLKEGDHQSKKKTVQKGNTGSNSSPQVYPMSRGRKFSSAGSLSPIPPNSNVIDNWFSNGVLKYGTDIENIDTVCDALKQERVSLIIDENHQDEQQNLMASKSRNEKLTGEEDPKSRKHSKKSKKRLISLDILRGCTVMFMMIVNNLPSTSYWPLEHAEWNGITITDCVFPFFLWIMGYAIGISFRKKLQIFEYLSFYSMKPCFGKLKRLALSSLNSTSYEYEEKIVIHSDTPNHYHDIKHEIIGNHQGDYKLKQKHKLLCNCILMNPIFHEVLSILFKILKRTIILFLIGFGTNVFSRLLSGEYLFSTIRIMGVLQRISICYCITSLIYVFIPSIWIQIYTVLLLQVIYLAFSFGFWVRMPLCDGRGYFTPTCSAQAFIDQLVFTKNHTHASKPYDPEGVLSTLSAVFTTYLGLLFYKIAEWSSSKQKKAGSEQEDDYHRITCWFLFSVCLCGLGVLINSTFFPYNKQLWTTSFAVLTAGLAGVSLCIICYIVDVLQWKKYWTQPILWVGSNPLLFFTLPIIIDIILLHIWIPCSPEWNIINCKTGRLSLFVFSYQILFVSWLGNTKFASLMFAITYETLYLPLAALLYRKKIFIKL